MKKSKRFAAIAVAAIMTVLCVGTASAETAYTSVTGTEIGTNGIVELKEKLEVTENGTAVPNLTYTLTFGNMQKHTEGTAPDEINYNYAADFNTNKDKSLNGKTFTVTYSPADGSGKGFFEKVYKDLGGTSVDLSGYDFTEPGIYYWQVTKTKVGPENATNTNSSTNDGSGTFYFVVRIDDPETAPDAATGKVKLKHTVGLVQSLTSLDPKFDTINDQYPVKNADLRINKKVTGNQGSKDEYFEFTVELSKMKDFIGEELEVEYRRKGDIDSKYSEVMAATDNHAKITIVSNGETGTAEDGVATAKIWLKDGEIAIIKNLPAGAEYKVTEDEKDYEIIDETTDNKAYTEAEVDAEYNPLITAKQAEIDAKQAEIDALDNTDTDYATKLATLTAEKEALTVEKTALETEKAAKKAKEFDDATEGTIVAADVCVGYTNEKKTATPTGIFLAMGPGLSTLVLAGAGLAVVGISRRKRENDIED